MQAKKGSYGAAMITKSIPDIIRNSKIKKGFCSRYVVRRQIDAKVTSPALFLAFFDFFTQKRDPNTKIRQV